MTRSIPKCVSLKGQPSSLAQSVLLSLLNRGSRCDMTRSIKAMGQPIFLSLLHHELVNDIPKSLSSGQKLIGHILSRNLLINILRMWRKSAW